MAGRLIIGIAVGVAVFCSVLAVVTTVVLQPNKDAERERTIGHLRERVTVDETLLNAVADAEKAQGALNTKIVNNQLHLARLVGLWGAGASPAAINRELAAVH